MAKSILPDIRGRLSERFIFNFALPGEVLQEHLPAWLRPQVFQGLAVASFCILDLHEVVFGSVPKRLGLRNVNCAHRFGVLDGASGEPTGDGWTITVRDAKDAPAFTARVRRAKEFRSELFGSLPDFQAFISGGVRSYCPAVSRGVLNIVDLKKEESRYEPLEVVEVHDRLLSEWTGAPALDSAVRTTGGTYIWQYHGQSPVDRAD